MVERNKKEKGINIYEVAGKVGKGVRKCSGCVLVVGALIITKCPDLIKKVKK